VEEIARHHIQFFTAVCNDWLNLLNDDGYKQIVIDSLKLRVAKGQIKVGAYVIMPNHIHIIWRLQNKFELEDVQRDFLKYTAKSIIEKIKKDHGEVRLEQLYVGLQDRKFQVWKRNSMSIDLITARFFDQKMDYIHSNPCQPHWNLANDPIEYRFSSARYYETGVDEFAFLTHMDEL
jgi:putative transposase